MADPAAPNQLRTRPLLYFSALGFGNLTCLVNDARLDVAAEEGAAGGAGRKLAAPVNCALVVAVVCGAPVPLLVTTLPLASHQELLISYGDDYWAAWRSTRASVMAARGGGDGGGWGADPLLSAPHRWQSRVAVAASP